MMNGHNSKPPKATGADWTFSGIVVAIVGAIVALLALAKGCGG